MADDTTLETTDQQAYILLKKKMPTASDADIWKGVAEFKKQGGKLPPLSTFSSLLEQGAAPQAPQQVEVTGKKIPPSAQVAALPAAPTPEVGPGTTAQDAIFAGKGGTAARLAPTDPAAYAAAAQQLYNKQGGNDNIYRGLSGLQATYSQGLGGQAGAVEANAKRWKDLDEAATTGNVAKQAELGGKGITSANEVLTQGQQAETSRGELDMKRRSFMQDYAIKGIAVDKAEKDWDQAQKLYDATSHASQLARAVAAKELGVDVKSIPAGMSALDLHDAMVGNKAYQEYFSGITARLSAEAQAGLAGAQTRATNLGTNLVSTATEGGTKVPPGMNLTVGAGPAGLAPSPAVTGQQSGAANTVNALRDRNIANETNGVGRVTSAALKGLGSASYIDTGKFGAALAKVPGTDAAGTRSSIAAYYVSKGLEPQAAQREAEAIFELSPSQGALRMAQIAADTQATKRQSADADAYVAARGSLAGYQPKPYRSFYNPKTGDVVMGDTPKDKPKGYIDLGGK